MGLQDDSARNPSRPSPNSSNFSSIQTISLRERAHRWSALTCPTPVQSRDFFHSSYDRALSGTALPCVFDVKNARSQTAPTFSLTLFSSNRRILMLTSGSLNLGTDA